MTQTQAIEAALRKSKAFFGITESEPRTTFEQILLRELGEAAAKVLAKEDDEVQKLIWQALRSGDLIAQTVAGIPIPSLSWPTDPDSWSGNNWYWGTVFLDGVTGFDGELPIIPKADCVAWLARMSNEGPKRGGRPRKDRAGIKRAYDAAYENGHEAVGDEWKDAVRVVSKSLGYVVLESTLKRALGRKK